jgi:methyl-accepting chemotaxis protein
MDSLYRFRLSTRLGGGFGLVLFLLLCVTGIALLCMNRMDQQMRQIVEVGNRRAALAQTMMTTANDSVVALYGFLLVADEADAKDQTAEFNGAMHQYDAARSQYVAMLPTDDNAVQAQLKRLDHGAVMSRSFNSSVVRMAAMGGNVANAFVANNPRVALGVWRTGISKLVEMENAAGKQAYDSARAVYELGRAILVGASLAALAAALAACFVILRSVTRPLGIAINHAQRISTGDLSVPIHTRAKDETGELLQALGQMQQQITHLVDAIRRATGGITHASMNIASGNMDLSARTEQTARHLEQASALISGLTESAARSAAASEQASLLASAAADAAHSGGDVVRHVIDAMGGISGNSRRIADITGVIDGIAFQTNILALNAAVEAARAGEQGRGFAVVAAEVRNLAQRSAAAAKEIKQLIGTSVDKVEGGTRLVRNAGLRMEEIMVSVQRVNNMIDELGAAARQQNSGIVQVNDAVSELDRMTRQNAIMVQQGAAAAADLEQQGNALTMLVNNFRIGEPASAVPSPLPPPSRLKIT